MESFYLHILKYEIFRQKYNTTSYLPSKSVRNVKEILKLQNVSGFRLVCKEFILGKTAEISNRFEIFINIAKYVVIKKYTNLYNFNFDFDTFYMYLITC